MKDAHRLPREARLQAGEGDLAGGLEFQVYLPLSDLALWPHTHHGVSRPVIGD